MCVSNIQERRHYKTMIRAASLALIVFLLQAASCDKEEEKEFVEVWPRMPVNISPPGETIGLGDTLWVNIDLPDTVEDYLTKKYYKAIDYDFFTSLMLLRLIGPTVDRGDQPAAASSFTFHARVGQVYDISSLSGKLKFDYSNSKYKAHVGLVAKQKGVFSLIMLYRGSDIENRTSNINILDSTPGGKERLYWVQHICYILNNGDFHFDLYQANCLVDPEIRTADPYFDEMFNTYTFEVK